MFTETIEHCRLSQCNTEHYRKLQAVTMSTEHNRTLQAITMRYRTL